MKTTPKFFFSMGWAVPFSVVTNHVLKLGIVYGFIWAFGVGVFSVVLTSYLMDEL